MFAALAAGLAHVDDDGAGAFDDVAVDDGGVALELILGEAALVDDLHLLDDGALAGLAGAWEQEEDERGAEREERDLPRRRILHSRLRRRLSWSRERSMSSERILLCWSFWEKQAPMAATGGGRGRGRERRTGSGGWGQAGHAVTVTPIVPVWLD